MNCLVIHDANGRITELHEGSFMEPEELPGVLSETRCHPSTHYVLGGVVVARPPLAAQLDGLLLTGVPAGASVVIEGETYAADGSDIELEFGLPGFYTIRVRHWPFMDWEVVVENPA